MSTRDLVASTSSSSAPATAAAVVVAVDSAVVDTPTSQRGPAPSSSTAVTSEYAQYSNDNYRYADDPSLPAPVTVSTRVKVVCVTDSVVEFVFSFGKTPPHPYTLELGRLVFNNNNIY